MRRIAPCRFSCETQAHCCGGVLLTCDADTPGVTALVVTHDMTSAFRIGTRMIMLGTGPNQGKIVASGTPEEIRASPNPEVQQFINGEPDGPVPLKLSRDDYVTRLLGHPRPQKAALP